MNEGIDDTPSDGVVSPELALVDPALRARLLSADEPPPTDALRVVTPPNVDPPPIPRRRIAHSRRVAVSILCTLLLLGLATAVYLWQRSGSGPAPAKVETTSSAPAPVSTETRPIRTSTRPQTPPGAPSRTFAWAPADNASAYEVEIARNGTTVYSARTRAAHLRIPALSAGSYRWYVWPLVSEGSKTRRAKAIVAASFDVRP